MCAIVLQLLKVHAVHKQLYPIYFAVCMVIDKQIRNVTCHKKRHYSPLLYPAVMSYHHWCSHSQCVVCTNLKPSIYQRQPRSSDWAGCNHWDLFHFEHKSAGREGQCQHCQIKASYQQTGTINSNEILCILKHKPSIERSKLYLTPKTAILQFMIFLITKNVLIANL